MTAKRSLSVCAIALLAVSLAIVGVEAKTKTKANASAAGAAVPDSALAECYKQAGAFYNQRSQKGGLCIQDMKTWGFSDRIVFADAWPA